ncbi:MAG: hypothetical protein QXS74_06350 [Nitrososphaeria archaeon]
MKLKRIITEFKKLGKMDIEELKEILTDLETIEYTLRGYPEFLIKGRMAVVPFKKLSSIYVDIEDNITLEQIKKLIVEKVEQQTESLVAECLYWIRYYLKKLIETEED